MPVTGKLPGGGVGFWLAPADIEPSNDPAWFFATPTLRRRFWGEAMRVAASVWDTSRAKGLDRFDRRLAAIAPSTRRHRRSAMGPADPAAPPLIPAHALSRTRSYLQYWYVEGRGGWFWWKMDPRTRASWGVILDYHARGRARGGKVRDVIGFSPRELAAIRAQMDRWWQARRGAVPGVGPVASVTITRRVLGVSVPPPVPPSRPIVPKPATPLPPGWHTSQTTTRFGGHLDFFSRPAAWLRSHMTPWRQYRPPTSGKDS